MRDPGAGGNGGATGRASRPTGIGPLPFQARLESGHVHDNDDLMMLGYRRRDVEEALGARDRALEQLRVSLADTETRLAAAKATLESHELELRSQRKQIEALQQGVEELDKVATLLAEWVVGRERELCAVRAELIEERGVEDNAHLGPAAVAEPRSSLGPVR